MQKRWAPCQVAVAPRITCRFGTWGSCGRRRRSSGYQPSSGFWCASGFAISGLCDGVSCRVAVNRASEGTDRSQNVGLSAIHFEMRVLPPLVGLVVSAGGDRRARRGGESCRGAKKPPAGAPVTRGEYGEVVERITEEVVLGRVAMIACILWAKCGHHPSFSWPMPRWTWRSSNRNRARVDILLCSSATTAGYARFPALIVH